MMLQQLQLAAQRVTLQSQVHLSQQIVVTSRNSVTFTSVNPLFSSEFSTSQTVYSQPIAANFSVAQFQSYSEPPDLSYQNSINRASSSQVYLYTLYIHI